MKGYTRCMWQTLSLLRTQPALDVDVEQKKFQRGVIIIWRSRSINYCPYVQGMDGQTDDDIPSIKRQSVGQAGRQ